MKTIKAFICSIALFAMFAGTAAQAKTEIQWCHAFGGRLGDLLDEQVNKFNGCKRSLCSNAPTYERRKTKI